VSTLVFLEHNGPSIQKGSLGVLSKAAALDPETSAVIIGSGLDDLVSIAGDHGATTVYLADDPAVAAPLPQPRVDVMAALVRDKGFDNVLFGSSVLAADIAGGLSSRLDAGLNWDLGDLAMENGELVGKRSALGDTIAVTVGWSSTPRIGLVRAGSFDPAPSGGTASAESVAVDVQDFSTKTTITGQDQEQASGPSIDEADILVTAGRGIGTPDAFPMFEELASAMGGAVATTRAVVDSGWYPYATQIGQTGKVVSPKLYIGFGVSGAIQHKVGMQSSQTIVAINKDPNAPIFEFSDMAVVGDLNTIVPELSKLVKERRG
jgi:electron transfer flavoprotein alpha subunit